ERLKREYHSIRQTNTETSMEFMQHFLRFAGFRGAAAGTEEEQAKNFQWGLRRSTLNHLMCMSYTDVAQVANAARNYEILHERDDDDTERPDKRRVVIGIIRPLRRVVTGTTVIITTVMDQTGKVVVTTTAAATTTTLAVTTGVPVMDATRETGVSSPIDMPIMVPSSPEVPLRATPTQFALRVDADTQESVVELLVLASSVVKLAIYRRIARRTPLQVHLVRLIRS
nr:zinc finger, CCHC-type, retrotransposon Gag domain protein [Tanacetum cinerariifolium]